MIIPIKQILLEFSGSFTATKQKEDLVPKPNLKGGIPPENNGALTKAKSEATKHFTPSTLSEKMITDKNKILVKAQIQQA